MTSTESIKACQTPPPTMRDMMEMGYRPASTFPGGTRVWINPRTQVMVAEWLLIRDWRFALDFLRGKNF